MLPISYNEVMKRLAFPAYISIAEGFFVGFDFFHDI